MSATKEVSVKVQFKRADEDRYYISSTDIPGLHMAGQDIESLNAELETVIKDLLWYNDDIVVDRLRWVPKLDAVVERFKGNKAASQLDGEERTYVLTLKEAA